MIYVSSNPRYLVPITCIHLSYVNGKLNNALFVLNSIIIQDL